MTCLLAFGVLDPAGVLVAMGVRQCYERRACHWIAVERIGKRRGHIYLARPEGCLLLLERIGSGRASVELALAGSAARWHDQMMVVSRSVVIGRPIGVVFAFVADACNDAEWCPKVLSVEQSDGDAPGPAARYKVMHRPIPMLPPREIDHRCVGWAPPNHIEWREDDGADVLTVTYSLEDLGDSTRLTQRSDAQLGAPRLLHPLMRFGIGRDIQRQLNVLKTQLESSDPTTQSSSYAA